MVAKYKSKQYEHNKTISMSYLIEWFQINYPQLCRDLINCKHNADDMNLNPYHLESDCWSHTMLVCKVAELHKYDKEVLIAALLHDIGKPKARKINPKNNHVQFFGHEELSVELAEEVLCQMQNEKMINRDEGDEIKELIGLHSLLHNDPAPHILFERFKDRKELYMHLVQLNYCDHLGRFCEHNDPTDKKFNRLMSYSKNMCNTNLKKYDKICPYEYV